MFPHLYLCSLSTRPNRQCYSVSDICWFLSPRFRRPRTLVHCQLQLGAEATGYIVELCSHEQAQALIHGKQGGLPTCCQVGIMWMGVSPLVWWPWRDLGIFPWVFQMVRWYGRIVLSQMHKILLGNWGQGCSMDWPRSDSRIGLFCSVLSVWCGVHPGRYSKSHALLDANSCSRWMEMFRW